MTYVGRRLTRNVWVESTDGRFYCPTMQAKERNKDDAHAAVELDPIVTGLDGCKCARGYIPSLAFLQKDVGLMMTIKDNDVKVDDKPRIVSWGSSKHDNCIRSIKSVEETLKGAVTLDNGMTFPNWACKKPVLFEEYKSKFGTIQDKAGQTRLRSGQSTEFRIRPPEARVIHINISKFMTQQNVTTTLELYEGHSILSSTPLEKWSNQNLPRTTSIQYFLELSH